MGIYIPGVLKKENFPIAVFADGEIWCNGKRVGKAIEIKEHGRLIDADELEPDENWSATEDGFISFSQFAINNAKTIIPEERGKE